MLTNLHNHNFQTKIYNIIKDFIQKGDEILNLDEENNNIIYKKSSSETIYFTYNDNKKMLSDWENYKYLIEAFK